MDQVVQIVGALLILSGYGSAQAGWLSTSSLVYLVLNLVGSAVLAVLAVHEEQWGFVLLEGVWAVISLVGIATRGGPRAVPPTH